MGVHNISNSLTNNCCLLFYILPIRHSAIPMQTWETACKQLNLYTTSFENVGIVLADVDESQANSSYIHENWNIPSVALSDYMK